MIAKHNPYIGQLYPIVIPIWLASIITQNRPKQPGFFHCSSGRCFGCIKYDQPEESGCFGVLKMTPLGEIGFLGNYQILPKRKRINFDLILYIKSACNLFMLSMCVAFISKIFSSTSLPLGTTAPFARRCSSKAVLGDQRDPGSVILLLVALRISRDLKSLVVWRSKRPLQNTGSFTFQLYGLIIF